MSFFFQRINYDKLKEKEKILFFDDVILYEDELDDNGCSKLSVKMVNLNPNGVLKKQAISGTSNYLILLKKKFIRTLFSRE